YAELGSTWRFVMRDPTTAAHLLGKLLKHMGEDNVLWGTDSIWYGSPQDQIQAFRSFQIAPALIEAYGYPELTPSLKQKVFGLNGARVYGIDVPERRRKTESIQLRRASRLIATWRIRVSGPTDLRPMPSMTLSLPSAVVSLPEASRMSALAQKRTLESGLEMSALPPKADMLSVETDVR